MKKVQLSIYLDPETFGSLEAFARRHGKPKSLVAEAAMHIFDLSELEICPWALREGVILERIDRISRSG